LTFIGLDSFVGDGLRELLLEGELVISRPTRDHVNLVALKSVAEGLGARVAEGSRVLRLFLIRKFALKTLQKSLIIYTLGLQII
jgi:hypothetical protein